MLGRPRLDGRRQGAQSRHVVVKGLGRPRGDVGDRFLVVVRGVDDLVVHIGDVADIGDVIVAIGPAQQAEQRIEHDDGPRIADMGEVVHRRPADIETHVIGIERREPLLLSRQRVVKHQTQCPILSNFGLDYAACPIKRAWARLRPIIGSRSCSSGPCSSPVKARRIGM